MNIDVNTRFLPLSINEKVVNYAMEKSVESYGKVLAIVTPTKPCFYKLWSLMNESEKRGIPYFILNPGQHYDELLGHGLKEFNFEERIGADLRIRGDLSQKSSELFIKTKLVVNYFKKKWPKITVLPYVNGDTVTAGVLPAAWMFSTNEKTIQGEAGLRSMAPKSFYGLNRLKKMELPKFIDGQFNGEWLLVRDEPFPEQWDTFVSAAGSQFFFTPIELNKEHLLREGYPEDCIWNVGNTVVDVIQLKKKEKSEKSIFDIYPRLEKGEWIRVDIHRRGNLTKRRFASIIDCVLRLVEKGYNIAFIELTAAKKALEYYNLRGKLVNLKKDNFLFTPLWKEYGQVIEFLESKNCWGVLTDSGSMQEEMNELGKVCLTARFNTDRPETVMNSNSNLLVPPLSGDFMTDFVEYVYGDDGLRKSMSSGKRLYGEEVAKKIVKVIEESILPDNPFRWAHETLGVWKEEDKKPEYL